MGEEQTWLWRHVLDRGSTHECHVVRGYRLRPPAASDCEGTATRHRIAIADNLCQRDRQTAGKRKLKLTPHFAV
jgi:hypothetical protein